jgi:hypothetical protein
MSDTPRTDYYTKRLRNLCDDEFVPIEFARKLERELSAVTEQRDRLAEACKLLMGVIGDPTASAEDWWATEDEINAAWNSGNAAISAVKGGSDE